MIGFVKFIKVWRSMKSKIIFKYDFIIRARTDYIIEKNNVNVENLHSLELNEIYSLRGSSGLGDSLEIGRRNAMENYMKTWMYVSEKKRKSLF